MMYGWADLAKIKVLSSINYNLVGI